MSEVTIAPDRLEQMNDDVPEMIHLRDPDRWGENITFCGLKGLSDIPLEADDEVDCVVCETMFEKWIIGI